MKIVVSPKAEKELKKISKFDQIAIIKKVRSLPTAHKHLRTEKLKGYPNIFRIRIGRYRIVYRKKPSEIYIVLIGHRKQIYQILKHLLR